MREKLTNLLNNSYAKYSNFRVSAICVMKDGREIPGVNVENASYGATICAERTAITGAVARGYKKGDFKELHVMCDSDKIGMPCFICRQVISELFNKEDKIYVYSKCDMKVYTVEEICPYPFTEDNL
jgi:cytidine deaminase